MKTIIAGSRTITDENLISQAIFESEFVITEVVCGMADGVDTIGSKWANKTGIPVKKFPAKWEKYGRSAGPIRNRQMAEYAEALILVWNGYSPGSKNMLQEAQKRGLKIYQKLIAKFV